MNNEPITEAINKIAELTKEADKQLMVVVNKAKTEFFDVELAMETFVIINKKLKQIWDLTKINSDTHEPGGTNDNEVWQWIEQKLTEAKIEENERWAKLAKDDEVDCHHSFFETRIKELRGEK